jgi:hypothetical protein
VGTARALAVRATLSAGVLCGGPADAQDTPLPRKPVPAEELRLNTGVFRAGLQKRGLAELLELHLREFPPTDTIEAALMLRDVKLADAADPGRSRGDRQILLAEANRLLEKLVSEHPQDPRRWEWRLTLARSLLYEEAAPCLTNILYRGGTEADRRAAMAAVPRAVQALRPVLAEIDAEYKRIDELSVHEFQALESQGYVETLDRVGPEAEYLLLWALFYDALPRTADEVTRAANLYEVAERLEANSALLRTPQDVSHVQVPMLLLSGMTERRLNKHDPARHDFERALEAAAQIQDSQELDRIRWAVSLAWLERIGNETDDGRYPEALRRLTEFRATIPPTAEAFSLRLAAALLERSILRARGEQTGAEARTGAWAPLARLIQQEPQRRAEVFAALYDLLGNDAATDKLDPLDQAALMAGLLTEVEQGAADGDRLLARVVAVGERFLSTADPDAALLRPDVLFDLGVAQYRRGRPAAAAERFLELGRDYRSFERALEAATYAVQLAAQLYSDPDIRGPLSSDAAGQLYRDALTELMAGFPDSEAARYWRVYYGQLLEDLGEFEAAAAQYAMVARDHEHATESAFARTRCLANVVRRWVETRGADPRGLPQRADEFFGAFRELMAAIQAEEARESDRSRRAQLRRLRAEAVVLKAELQTLPALDRALAALETLQELDPATLEDPALVARFWRARLIAFERTGRLNEAIDAVDRYRAADPVHFGPTLQALYASLAADAERLSAGGDSVAAQRRAEMAQVLASQIYEWAHRLESSCTPEEKRSAAVQRAEAHLHAGSVDRSLELFDELLRAEGSSPDARVLFGHAQALARRGRFTEALPEFNRLAVGLPANTPLRWSALLEDLRTRTELGHPPQGIINVIEQQKRLYPELGGPTLAGQFEKLLRENRRRLDGSP